MNIQGEGKYDLSIMASLNCNLRCPHCQYEAGPHNEDWLDQVILDRFLATVDWNDINSIGFYGGEISVDLDKWAEYLKKIDTRIKKWCITNGSWSLQNGHRWNGCTQREVVEFAEEFDLDVFISTTPYHTAHQNVPELVSLVQHSNRFRFKHDDTKDCLLPMGRNYKPNWDCTRRCIREPGVKRLAIKPDTSIIYQTCDGIYPIIAYISYRTVTWEYVKDSIDNRGWCWRITKSTL